MQFNRKMDQVVVDQGIQNVMAKYKAMVNGGRQGRRSRFDKSEKAKPALWHILPHSSRGWGVKKSGSYRTYRFAKTRRDAEKIAQRLINNNGGHVVIHDKHGVIVDSFGL